MIPFDEFGPEYVITVYDPHTQTKGFLVIDNTTLGPGKGGIRMTANVTQEEVFRLARTMTWKNALAGIPFGGAKAGIVWNGGDEHQKKAAIQSFARAIKLFTPKKYIAGPDVNTGERDMQWFVEATGNWRTATGKPANLCMDTFESGAARLKAGEPRPAGWRGGRCGIPHEFGSTGFGVAHAAAVAAELAGINLKGARVAIHGFGNVGTFTYEFLTEMGARVVALADKHTVLFSEKGFDKDSIAIVIKEHRPLSEYKNAEHMAPEAFWSIPTDILIPASVTDVVNDSNFKSIKTRIIVEAGNIPMREPIEEKLHKQGILIVPDFLANAGGVISSYSEYRGYNPKQMFELVKRKITQATKQVLKQSLKTGENPRSVALAIAKERILKKMKTKKT